MTGSALLTALQSQTEHDLLQTVLVPLFGAMGYERVSLEGGAHDRVPNSYTGVRVAELNR